MDLDLSISGEKAAQATGLITEDAVRNAAESRLRAARLFKTLEAIEANRKKVLAGPLDSMTDPMLRARPVQWLVVEIVMTSSAYSLATELRRIVPDTGSFAGTGPGGPVIVWAVGGAGTHGGAAHSILGRVSEQLDRFLTEYLRANPEC